MIMIAVLPREACGIDVLDQVTKLVVAIVAEIHPILMRRLRWHLEANDATDFVERCAKWPTFAVGEANEPTSLVVLDRRRIAANVGQIAEKKAACRRVPLERKHLAAVPCQPVGVPHSGQRPAERMIRGRSTVDRALKLLPIPAVVVDEDGPAAFLQLPTERVRPAKAERPHDVAPAARVVANELELFGRPKGEVHHLEEHLPGDGANRIAAALPAFPVLAATFALVAAFAALLALPLLAAFSRAPRAATRAAAAASHDRPRVHARDSNHVGDGCSTGHLSLLMR